MDAINGSNSPDDTLEVLSVWWLQKVLQLTHT